MALLTPLAANLWHVTHRFKANGVGLTSRMTVVRLSDGRLWLHSPVPITPQLQGELAALGQVAWIVAPNKLHHLFLSDAAAAFPGAQLYGAPGLAKKRPDVSGLQTLGADVVPAWREDFDQLVVAGFPIAHEVVWFHRPSRTLILTDLCQFWEGPLSWSGAAYAHLTGVRKRLAVPRTVRLMIKDKAAFAASARAIMQWRFERVIVAHNAIVEQDAHTVVARAFATAGV